jgi:acyl carrier protein
MEITRDALLTYLREKLKIDTSKIEDDSALFSSGLTDSFSMVDLILFLEKTGGFKMNPLDVNLDNLDSVERILAFVGRLSTQSKG